MSVTHLKPGDRVTYRDLSLREYRGTILLIERTPHGGDCRIAWDRSPVPRVQECLKHLILDASRRRP